MTCRPTSQETCCKSILGGGVYSKKPGNTILIIEIFVIYTAS